MHRMVANWKNPRIMDMVDFYYLFNYLFTAVQGNIRPDLNVQRLKKKSKLNVSLNLHNVVTTKTPSHIGGGCTPQEALLLQDTDRQVLNFYTTFLQTELKW